MIKSNMTINFNVENNHTPRRDTSDNEFAISDRRYNRKNKQHIRVKTECENIPSSRLKSSVLNGRLVTSRFFTQKTSTTNEIGSKYLNDETTLKRTMVKYCTNVDKHPLAKPKSNTNFQGILEELREIITSTSEQIKYLYIHSQITPNPKLKHYKYEDGSYSNLDNCINSPIFSNNGQYTDNLNSDYPNKSKKMETEDASQRFTATGNISKLVAENVKKQEEETKQMMSNFNQSLDCELQDKLVLPNLNIYSPSTRDITYSPGKNKSRFSLNFAKDKSRSNNPTHQGAKFMGKFRRYAYSVLFYTILTLKVRRRRLESKIKMLNYFVKDYPITFKKLKNWISSSVKFVLKSIVNFPEMNLVMLETDDATTSKQKFLKLQIRLTSLIEQLVNKKDQIKECKELITYLTCRDVPFKIFSYFELSRLNIVDKEVTNLTKTQKLMIISFYFLIKLLIKDVLLNFPVSSSRGKCGINNIRFISSILYYSIRDYFKTHLPIVSNISVENLVCLQVTWDYKEHRLDRIKDVSFYDKCLEVNRNKYKSYRNVGNLYLKANQTISVFDNDRDNNDIKVISKVLYRYEDLSQYFKCSKENGFDLMKHISNFCNNYKF